ARERGVEAHLLGPGEDVAELCARSGASILGVAGGDGSLAPVAQAAVETGAAFVCVPFGTRNHFARDLGLDRNDPAAALAAVDGVLPHRWEERTGTRFTVALDGRRVPAAIDGEPAVFQRRSSSSRCLAHYASSSRAARWRGTESSP